MSFLVGASQGNEPKAKQTVPFLAPIYYTCHQLLHLYQAPGKSTTQGIVPKGSPKSLTFLPQPRQPCRFQLAYVHPLWEL